MTRALKSGRHSGLDQQRPPRWLFLLTLLCVVLLSAAGTAHACHAHGVLLHATSGQHQLAAPVDECPLCAATHAALPAATDMTVAEVPQAEVVSTRPLTTRRSSSWSFDLFSRPPPAPPAYAAAGAGSAAAP